MSGSSLGILRGAPTKTGIITAMIPVYEKKPECPAQKVGPLGRAGVNGQKGFFFSRNPVRTNDVRWRKHEVSSLSADWPFNAP